MRTSNGETKKNRIIKHVMSTSWIPTLRINQRLIGIKLHWLEVCMQLPLVPSGLKAYPPPCISLAPSALHVSQDPQNPSLHASVAPKVNRHFGLCCAEVAPALPTVKACPRSGRHEGLVWDLHSMQHLGKWVLAYLIHGILGVRRHSQGWSCPTLK